MNSKFAVFWKHDEAFGGLSNLSEDFQLAMTGIRVRTSEHLKAQPQASSSICVALPVQQHEDAINARNNSVSLRH